LQVKELFEMLRTANFLDGKTTDLTTEEIIHLVEKYYDPSNTLKTKLSDENFNAYLAANPHLLPEEPKKEEAAEEGAECEPAVEEGIQEQPEEGAEMTKELEQDSDERIAVHSAWKENIINEHLVYVQGVEIVFHEF
jgi:hypothetical protein